MSEFSFEDYIERRGRLTYRNTGTSMWPMLVPDRDLFTVHKKSQDRCKKYDVVLYRRRESYVLHRIIQVRESEYVILGDNCIEKEYGVRDRDILGVMTHFVHKGRRFSVHDLRYRAYVQLWCKIISPVRRAFRSRS